ncbi:hypothetical protein UFOVP221_14 [uncultured Caudovirales phage]|uniref:Uncharacterized protein n=1 Tax=uncultured Caudovirales phage TaxID=2100421 RepID=A0A6J7WLM9_9CAUD|nr:hypothetical protein UFOVP221_14 [uncultured Caudovirales phage]
MTESTSSEATPTFRIRFSVTVGVDGGVSIDPNIPEDMKDKVERQATIIDIIDASRKLVADLERQVVLDGLNEVYQGIEQRLSIAFPAPEATVSAKVKDALNERGITPAE